MDRNQKTRGLKLTQKIGRQLVFVAIGAILATGMLEVALAAEVMKKTSSSYRHLNVQVDSAQLEPFSLDERLGQREEKPVFYEDQNASVGFNDNGEPNMSMRF